MPIEVKTGQTVAADLFDGLHTFQTLAGRKAKSAGLVYDGTRAQTRDKVTVYPLANIHDLSPFIKTL